MEEKQFNTELFMSEITHIRNDISEIKDSIKEMGRLNLHRSEFETFYRSEFEPLKNNYLPYDDFEAFRTREFGKIERIVNSGITFILLAFLSAVVALVATHPEVLR